MELVRALQVDVDQVIQLSLDKFAAQVLVHAEIALGDQFSPDILNGRAFRGELERSLDDVRVVHALTDQAHSA